MMNVIRWTDLKSVRFEQGKDQFALVICFASKEAALAAQWNVQRQIQENQLAETARESGALTVSAVVDDLKRFIAGLEELERSVITLESGAWDTVRRQWVACLAIYARMPPEQQAFVKDRVIALRKRLEALRA